MAHYVLSLIIDYHIACIFSLKCMPSKWTQWNFHFFFNELYLKWKSRVKFAILVNLLIAVCIILVLPLTYCFGSKKILKLFLGRDSMLTDNCTILVINIIPRLMDFSHHDIFCKFLGWTLICHLGNQRKKK